MAVRRERESCREAGRRSDCDNSNTNEIKCFFRAGDVPVPHFVSVVITASFSISVTAQIPLQDSLLDILDFIWMKEWITVWTGKSWLPVSQATLYIIWFPCIIVVTYVNVDIHSICLVMILSRLKSLLVFTLYTNLFLLTTGCPLVMESHGI